MNILIVTGIFPPDIGGPATYVPRIASALANRGHHITVFTLSEEIDRNDSKFPFTVIRQKRERAFPARAVTTIPHLVRLGRLADVLFVNGLALETTLANLMLRKPLLLKVVGDLAWEWATNKGWVTDDFETFQTTTHGATVEGLKAMQSWWTRRATSVIVPSQYLGRWVTGWGVPESKIRLIYNAVDPANDLRATPLELNTQWRVATAGRLVPWKRVDAVIRAMTQLDQTGLVVIGDGPERLKLENLVRALGLQERVRFMGQRSRQETLYLMAACRVFVLNSTYEGLPHVALEAMSLGLPVVAAAVGGTPEIVKDGENGRLIDPVKDNEREIADLVRGLLSDSCEWKKLSEGAHRMVQRHSMAQMLEATEAELVSTCSANTSLL